MRVTTSSLTIDQHIHSEACLARFANTDGMLGMLKSDEEEPSLPISMDAEILRTTQIWADEAAWVSLLSSIETDFVAEVAACLASGTVTSHLAITAYLSMWEIRSRLNADPPAGRIGYLDAVHEHDATLVALEAVRWGVVRASGRSRFICSDRPNGMAYLPISREHALVGNQPDGMASEASVRLWNREAAENGLLLIFGHPDDVEAFSKNRSM